MGGFCTGMEYITTTVNIVNRALPAIGGRNGRLLYRDGVYHHYCQYRKTGLARSARMGEVMERDILDIRTF